MLDVTGLMALVYNGTILLSLAVIYDVATTTTRDHKVWWQAVLLGITSGVISMLLMVTSWTLMPGVVFDTRSVALAITGLFFGTVPALIAMGMTVALRLYLGGAGAFAGTAVIVASGCIGLAWRYRRRMQLATLSWGELLLFGLVVHLAMLALMLTLPWPGPLTVLPVITLPVLLLYPLITAMVGRLIVNRLQRRRAIAAMQASEERHRSYVDSAPYGVFVVDQSGRFREVNPAACRITGYSADELLSMSIADAIDASGRIDAARHFQRVVDEGSAYGEFPFRRKDGSVGWWSVAAVRVAPTHFIGFVEEITEARQAGAALRQSEERFRSIASTISDVAFACTEQQPDGFQIEWITGAVERITGYSTADVLAMRCWSKLVVPADLPNFALHVPGLAIGESSACELRLRRSDGAIAWIEATTTCVAGEGGRRLYGALVDISARKRAELALLRRDALLEALSYAAARFLEVDDWESVMPAVLSHLGIAANVSRAYLVRVESTPGGTQIGQGYVWCGPALSAPLAGAALPTVIDDAASLARWQDVLANGGLIRSRVRDLPAREQTLLSEQGIQSLVVVPIHVAKQWWGFVGFERCDEEYEWSDAEIEALRAIGHALGAAVASQASRTQVRQQAAQLAQIMESVPDGLLLIDRVGHLLTANQRGHAHLALLAGTQAGGQIVTLGDRPLAAVLAPGRAGQAQVMRVRQHTFEVLANQVAEGGTPGMWVLVIRDVTEELSRQQQLERQERLAAIGQLAAGIAHDFNNLMSIIILNAQLIERAPALNSYIGERVRIIQSQGQRAAQMIRQILDFSRRTAIDRQPVILAALLKEQIKLLERMVPESIKMAFLAPSAELYVRADPARIEQIVMNLAVNARDAMPDGGELTFALDTVEVASADHAPLPGMAPGTWARLTVSDTGVGIPLEHQSHIFEPFFTTKSHGFGTGLGLAQVHGIVGQHDGQIVVSSREGAGTTFTLYLPALTMVQPGLREPVQLPPKAAGQGECILVAEDEPDLRATLVNLLESWNYRVVAVANGREALALLDDGTTTVDLILSDVIMPEMSGIALLKSLYQRQSTIPLLLMTGYLQGEDLEQLRQVGLRGWLAKPPSIDQLAQAIADVFVPM